MHFSGPNRPIPPQPLLTHAGLLCAAGRGTALALHRPARLPQLSAGEARAAAAHRLVTWAGRQSLAAQDKVVEALFDAYFSREQARPDAGACSAASGVRSPMLIASPAKPL